MRFDESPWMNVPMPAPPSGGRLIFDSAGFPLKVVRQADRRPHRILAGLALSLLVHSGLLWLNPPQPVTHSAVHPSLEVSLLPPAQPAQSAPQVPEAIEPPPRPAGRRARLMTAPQRAPVPEVAVPPAEPEPVRAPVAETPGDFSSLLEARRRERRRLEEAIANANAQWRAAESGIEADPGAAAARRNLAGLGNRRPGTGGVFSILDKGHRTARYAFNGWSPSRSGGWKEIIEVDAGPQGDVNLAIVRSMIALIRKHYQGNFNWESHRLGRVVVLSARLEDNEGLEAFMLKEFF